MKSVWKLTIYIIIPIASIITPICWDLLKEDNKELTIQQERKIEFLNILGDRFNIYTNDSIILRDYCFYEYSIINTGNTTIVGYGANSDILTSDNSLQIAPDTAIVNLYSSSSIATLEHNHIYFKQIRPGEKITLICATNEKTGAHVLSINDRDLKDTNIKYTTFEDKLTTFEKTSTEDRWGQTIGFIVNLIFIIAIVIFNILDYINNYKGKRKQIVILWIAIWLICLIYTLSLPIRWLL